MTRTPALVLLLAALTAAQTPQPSHGRLFVECFESIGAIFPTEESGLEFSSSNAAGRLRVDAAGLLGIPAPPFTGSNVLALDSTGGLVTNELALHVDPSRFPAREFEISFLAYVAADELHPEDVFVLTDGVTPGLGADANGATGVPGFDGHREHLLLDWGGTLAAGVWVHVVLTVDAAYHASHPGLDPNGTDYRVVLRQRDDMSTPSDGLAIDCLEARPIGSVRVDSSNAAPGSGSTDDPFRSIQVAIGVAPPGAAVIVAAGVYLETLDFLGKNLLVSGAGPGLSTVNGGGAGSVVRFVSGEGSDSILDGFTISGGLTAPGVAGGGVSCVVSSPTITGCRITGNITGSGLVPILGAGHGGGIACAGSSPTIVDCEIDGNTTGNGVNAAGFMAAGPGGSGGGIHVDGASSPTILRCSIHDNLCGNGGAGAITPPGFGGRGGGIAFESGSSGLVASCELVSNQTGNPGPGVPLPPGLGGGIFCEFSSSPVVIGCTVTGNSVNAALAIQSAGIRGAGSNMTCTNTIIWGNLPSTSQADGGVYTYCDIEGGLAGTGNISNDPLFLSGSDLRLQESSPCIDAGDPATAAFASTTDIGGLPRVLGLGHDIGAHEFDTCRPTPGSDEGLEITTTVNGLGVPTDCLKAISAFDLLDLGLAPTETALVGLVPVILGQLFNTMTPPGAVPGFPEVHVDPATPGLFVLFDGNAPPPGSGTPVLPPGGLGFAFVMPPGLSGVTLRLQGFALDASAINGFFVASPATNLVF